jgi:steroid 5-alpha reductase family enzyme
MQVAATRAYYCCDISTVAYYGGVNMLLLAFYIALGINLLMFIPAFIYKTDQLTDISYAVSFVVVATGCYILGDGGTVQTLLLACVYMWAVRLGTFLFIRIRKRGHDKRFDGMREYFFKFIRFWILQGVTVFVVLIGATLAWDSPPAYISNAAYAGVYIFGVGLVLESLADLQKYRFSNKTTNKGKWIDVGVWRLSRHPNYLGEMLVWIGIYLISVTAIVDDTPKLVALLSPLFIILLLLFVSGIPLLEKSANNKWGTVAEYKAYKRAVPVLIPSLRSFKRYLSQ